MGTDGSRARACNRKNPPKPAGARGAKVVGVAAIVNDEPCRANERLGDTVTTRTA